MKKISLAIVLLSILLIGMKSFATVVTERRISKPAENSYNQTNQTQRPTQNIQTQTSQNKKSAEFSNSMKTCKPYSETMKADYLGMNMNYKIAIAGWVNNKCRVDFTAEVAGVASTFEAMYGMAPAEASISAFAPKIRCEFTRQQLEYVGDSLLQEEERNAGAVNNMLKDPKGVNLAGLATASGSDAKLLDVVLGSNACTILNGGDMGKMLQNMMGY